MLERIDAHIGGYGAEFADIGVNAFAMALDVGKIPYNDVTQDDAFANIGKRPASSVFKLGGLMDAWLGVAQEGLVWFRHVHQVSESQTKCHVAAGCSIGVWKC